jgi:hypothetical protein
MVRMAKWICLQTWDCTPAVAGLEILKPEGRRFTSAEPPRELRRANIHYRDGKVRKK